MLWKGGVLSFMDQKISGPQRAALRKYTELLASYEGRVRLTGPTDAETIWKDHVEDCLFTVPCLPPQGRIIDVGSGGGLPGLVWAILRPELEVTLLDSTKKKCVAMEEISSALELTNVRVAWGRCEEFALSERESFALAGARAVAETGILAEFLSPLVMQGGRALAMKGPKYAEELAPLKGKWHRLGFDEPTILPYTNQSKSCFLLLWQKSGPCPPEFPRKTGMASKKFWWR